MHTRTAHPINDNPQRTLANEDLLQAFNYDLQLRNLTPKTISCYLERTGYFVKYLHHHGATLAQVDRNVIQDYILSVKGSVSDETVNGRLRVFKVFWNFLLAEGLWSEVSPMKNVRMLRVAKRAKPVISPEDLQRVFKAIDRRTFTGFRDVCMLMIFWSGMIRLKEMRDLTAEDVDFQGRRLHIREGKGRKGRIIPLGVRTLKLLQQYLVRWRSQLPGEPLICMRSGEPLASRHVHKTVQRRGQRVGVKLNPHLLRHSAATWYAKQRGSNLEVLRQILGHSTLLVTQNYLHLSPADLVADHALLSPDRVVEV